MAPGRGRGSIKGESAGARGIASVVGELINSAEFRGTCNYNRDAKYKITLHFTCAKLLMSSCSNKCCLLIDCGTSTFLILISYLRRFIMVQMGCMCLPVLRDNMHDRGFGGYILAQNHEIISIMPLYRHAWSSRYYMDQFTLVRGRGTTGICACRIIWP